MTKLKSGVIVCLFLTIYLAVLIALVTIRIREQRLLINSGRSIIELTKKSLARQALLTELRKGSDYVQVKLLEMLIETDRGKKNLLVIQLNTEIKRNDQNVHNYESLIADVKERQLVNALIAVRDIHKACRQRLLQLIGRGRRRAANAYNEHILNGTFENFQQANSALAAYVDRRDKVLINEISGIFSLNEHQMFKYNTRLIYLFVFFNIMLLFVLIRLRLEHHLQITNELRYSALFDLSPLPTWIVDILDGRLIEANKAAVNCCGYSESEFSAMKIDELIKGAVLHQDCHEDQVAFEGNYTHITRGQKLVDFQIYSKTILLHGKHQMIVVAVDMTKERENMRIIERQNDLFKDIAWTQSHVVRAPLARLLGILHLMEQGLLTDVEKDQMLRNIHNSAVELDNIIKDTIERTYSGQ